MDEIRMRIITNAAARQSQRRLTQLKRINAGHSQINRLRLNMQAVFPLQLYEREAPYSSK